ncbi:MAG: hypothetical protein HOV97_05275 [Nonomuraea sp.]|nr:hypothetical protein [Nonomuraea sp.]
MAVQARFWVQWVKKSAAANGEVTREVFLAPVISPTQGNDNWSKYTPSGEIRLVVTADAAGQWFEDHLAQNLAITFDVAPKLE